MSKTLEQTIHDAELPLPSQDGEHFSSYISRVAHAAAFIGAAWAITNGPQVQPREPEETPGPERRHQPGAPAGIYDTTDGRCDAALMVEGTHYQCDQALDHTGWAHGNREASAIWRTATGTHHQDAPSEVVRERD